MSEKRKDSKNRLLHNGESQRKDGRYVYKYHDITGKPRFLYSWRLTANDRMPPDKTPDLSLREKEAKAQQELYSMVLPNGGDLTVCQLVDHYLSLKLNVRHNTAANYQFVRNILAKEAFGCVRIDRIKLSDAKAWLVKMQKDGRGYSTIQTVRGVVRPAFEMAVKDDLLRKNPFDFELASVVVNDSVTREAISRSQQRTFLNFVQQDRHFSKYYDGIYILFHTGLRISEFCGLTISDVDFKNQRIRVDHQLQRTRDMEYIIEKPKTKSGDRYVPMSRDVEECFRRILARRPRLLYEPMVDGYAGFLMLDKNGQPMVALHWEHYFKHILDKYNSIYKVQLPKITPHVCRHTFCSNMAKSGMNPKTLQYIMGHSDISVTLNTYTHLEFEDAQEEFKRVVSGKNSSSVFRSKAQ